MAKSRKKQKKGSRRERTIPDPHLGGVKVRVISPKQRRGINRKITSLGDAALDVEAERLPNPEGLTAQELRNRVRGYLWMVEVCSAAIVDTTLRWRLGLDDSGESPTAADLEAMMRVAEKV